MIFVDSGGGRLDPCAGHFRIGRVNPAGSAGPVGPADSASSAGPAAADPPLPWELSKLSNSVWNPAGLILDFDVAVQPMLGWQTGPKASQMSLF